MRRAIHRRKHQQIAALAAVATAVAASGACVSTPRPVGPTTVFGVLPAPAVGASATADRAPGSTDGPLRFMDPVFAWTHASPTSAAYRWEATVENPAHTEFTVTVVMQLLDTRGRPVETSSRSFRLAGEERLSIEDAGTVEGTLVPRISGWQLEYWVQLPTRPPR